MPNVISGNAGNITTPLLRTINGATNSGGGIKISTTIAHTYSTGDYVAVANVGGVPNATGTWQITVVDATHFTLNFSTFGGAYTSGGTATDYSLTPAFNIIADGEALTADNLAVSFQALADRTQFNAQRLQSWIVSEDLVVGGTSGVTLASNATATFADALVYSSVTGVQAGDRLFITGGCLFEDGGTACIIEARLCADDGTVHALLTQKGDFDASADAMQLTFSGKFVATSSANVTLRLQFRNANNAQTILAIGQGYFHYRLMRGNG